MAATAQSPGWLLVPAGVSWHQPRLASSQEQDSSGFSFPISDKIVHELFCGVLLLLTALCFVMKDEAWKIQTAPSSQVLPGFQWELSLCWCP